jgi:hypothetical protein
MTLAPTTAYVIFIGDRVEITITLVLDARNAQRIRRAVERAFRERDDGPWKVWLGPHDSDRSRWRLSVTCPGYTTTVSLGHREHSAAGVKRRLQEILSAPVRCLEASSTS